MVTRILYLDHAPFWGGAERVLETHLKLLDRRRFFPFVGVSKGHPEFGERFAKTGAGVFTLPFGRLKSLNPLVPVRFARSVLAVVDIIRKNNIALLVTNTSRAFYLGVVAAQLVRTPVVAWVHDFLYIRPLFRKILPFASGVVWTSEAVRKFYGIRLSESSRVIYPENRFEEALRKIADEDALKLREVWGVSENDVVIGFVGRLVEAKGVQFLLRAVAMLRDKVSENFKLKLIIVGSGRGQRGSNEEGLKNLVNRLDLEDKVIFVGFEEHPAVFYKAFDIFVLPSVGLESYPTVVVEAMLAGLPVIGTRRGGTVELVEDGKTGLLVPPGDTEALAKALLQLSQEVDSCEAMGKAGRKKALEKNAGLGATKEVEKFFLKVAGSQN